MNTAKFETTTLVTLSPPACNINILQIYFYLKYAMYPAHNTFILYSRLQTFTQLSTDL